jgi:hypothetical protein
MPSAGWRAWRGMISVRKGALYEQSFGLGGDFRAKIKAAVGIANQRKSNSCAAPSPER